jgi:O-antigen/teichoic acid export membrane protein
MQIHKKVNSPSFQNNLWTFLASGVFSVFVFLLVLITTRLIGLAEAGMVSFAAAVVTVVHSVVLFSVRAYQSTDINQEFSMHCYFGLRVCSAILASLLIGVFLLISRFETKRTTIILLLYFVFLTDGFADVFMGDLQQKGKMRIAGRMRVSALGIGIIAFTVIIMTTQNIIAALSLSGAGVFVSYIAWIWYYRHNFGKIRVKYDVGIIITLVKNVWPLFIGQFLFSYLYNTQKYYLGFLQTDEAVAILSILILPATALQLLSGSFFAGAEMTKTAQIYTSGQMNALGKRFNRQILFALAIAVVFILCAFTFGIPLLSLLFDVDLRPYTQEFIVVSFGSALFAFLAVLSASSVVLRVQRAWLYCIASMAIIVAPIMWIVVAHYGLTGAALTNLAILAPLTIMLFVLCRYRLGRLKAEQSM